MLEESSDEIDCDRAQGPPITTPNVLSDFVYALRKAVLAVAVAVSAGAEGDTDGLLGSSKSARPGLACWNYTKPLVMF